MALTEAIVLLVGLAVMLALSLAPPGLRAVIETFNYTVDRLEPKRRRSAGRADLTLGSGHPG